MKKIFLSTAFAVALTFSISSCSKETEGCTDSSASNYDENATSDDGSCIDLTTDLVGTYNGAVVDSTVNGTSVTFNSEQITVSKVDNGRIKVSPANGGVLTEFTASIEKVNGAYLITIPSQTSGNYTLAGLIISGSTANGSYNPATNVFGTVTTITDGNETTIEGFQGQKQ